MTCTSMPSEPASLMILVTFEPPPASCCHRLRWLDPITIWVIWCSCAKLAMARAGIVAFDLVPAGADVGRQLRAASRWTGGRRGGGVAGATCTTSSSALSRDGHPGRPPDQAVGPRSRG